MSRHREEIDELIKAIKSISKKPILIDQQFVTKIGGKLEDRFVSKERFDAVDKQVSNLTQLVLRVESRIPKNVEQASPKKEEEKKTETVQEQELDKEMSDIYSASDPPEAGDTDEEVQPEHRQEHNDDDAASDHTADTAEITEAISEHENRLMANDLSETEKHSPVPPTEIKLQGETQEYSMHYPMKYTI